MILVLSRFRFKVNTWCKAFAFTSCSILDTYAFAYIFDILRWYNHIGIISTQICFHIELLKDRYWQIISFFSQKIATGWLVYSIVLKFNILYLKTFGRSSSYTKNSIGPCGTSNGKVSFDDRNLSPFISKTTICFPLWINTIKCLRKIYKQFCGNYLLLKKWIIIFGTLS